MAQEIPSIANTRPVSGKTYDDHTLEQEDKIKYKQKLDIFEASSIAGTETISQLLDKNPELLNSLSPGGFTALGLASFFGHLFLVKLLLDKSANPNIASNNQFKVAPIHSACVISAFDIAERLIEHGGL